MKKLSILPILLIGLSTATLTGCKGFLDQEPDTILTSEQIFSDPDMIKSALANLYGRVDYGQHTQDWDRFNFIDESERCMGGPRRFTNYPNDFWRVYDYYLLRNINQCLQGLRQSTAVSEAERKGLEGEVRFIRAWYYFNMARSLGGMPIVGDKVFSYDPGTDVTDLQLPRATEAEVYDYVIKECDEISANLSPDTNKNSARANKWAALMLKARAALYAGSIAEHNSLMETPIRLQGGEVGIPASEAQKYYKVALDTAERVIAESPYRLQKSNKDLARNFYDAICTKDNNSEVIWARDYITPGLENWFTRFNIPVSHTEDADRASSGVVLNLVEAFEYIDQRDGRISTQTASGDYIYYDSPLDAFANKDPRLRATVILPGDTFKETPVVLQAGLKKQNGDTWQNIIGAPGERDKRGRLVTSINGPVMTIDEAINKTGFFIRKFMDETPGASRRGQGSAMWYPRFRIAEAYLIASEAAFGLGEQSKALTHLNTIRDRAGLKALTQMTFQDIVRENQVEFAFENHRFWDLKRWRLAHKIWDGGQNDHARHQVLFPYRIDAPGTEYDGKWVFDKSPSYMMPDPLKFEMRNYYNFLDQAWLNNNPKLVKNPYQ